MGLLPHLQKEVRKCKFNTLQDTYNLAIKLEKPSQTIQELHCNELFQQIARIKAEWHQQEEASLASRATRHTPLKEPTQAKPAKETTQVNMVQTDQAPCHLN